MVSSSSKQGHFSDSLLRLVISASQEKATALAMAGCVPLLVSTLWYYSRTVIEVTGDEQKMWVQTWMDQKCPESVKRLRKLVLDAGSSLYTKQKQDPYGMRLPNGKQAGEPLERENGRFAPPTLSFVPPDGLSSWTWFGWWPVSIASSKDANGGGNESWNRWGSRKTYKISVWFAPHGLTIAQKLLLQGRELYLAKRAKVTEIWIGRIVDYGYSAGRETFSVVARPSRPLSTVIIEGTIKQNIRSDALKFLGGEQWYVEKGIPYRRGYLLYGPPGCGKTSLVTALAVDLRLPIVLVSLGNKDMTDQNLMKFLSDIPRDSIVLLEDIDCAVRMDGRGNSDKEGAEESKKESEGDKMEAPVAAAGSIMSAKDTEDVAKKAFGKRARRMPARGGGGLTLSGLLNAIDGVGAQEGRLLFMTTNNIENLDKALIRPGRVDQRFYFGRASKEAAGQLFDQFFKSGNNDENGKIKTNSNDDNNTANNDTALEHARTEFLARVNERTHSFAELQGVLMQAREDPTMVATAMEEFLESKPSSPGN